MAGKAPLASPAAASAEKRLPKLGDVAAMALEKLMPSRIFARNAVASVLTPESSLRRSIVPSAGSSWMPLPRSSLSSSVNITTCASLSLIVPVTGCGADVSFLEVVTNEFLLAAPCISSAKGCRRCLPSRASASERSAAVSSPLTTLPLAPCALYLKTAMRFSGASF